MTTVLYHASQYFINSSCGTIYMVVEVTYDKSYTIKFTIHSSNNGNWNCEKYIRDIPYIPTPMLEMIKLLQLHENDARGEKIYEFLSTIFNSTSRNTMQKEYETSKIDAITIRKDEIEKENETLQLKLHELEKENTKLKEHLNDFKTKYHEQTHKLTYTHYELLQSTSNVTKLNVELSSAQSIIKQLSQDLEDSTTELKMYESICMKYEDELYELEQKNDSSLDTILETAMDELHI